MNKENVINDQRQKRKRKRSINTTKEQYEIYLSIMEQDYILRSDTINPTIEENYIQKKWEDMVIKLNSCGNGACLSVEDWKKRFNDWKNSIRAKFRKIKESLNRTGGGEAAKIHLTDLEERGLSVWGKVTVTGSNLVEESGGLQHINVHTSDEITESSATLSCSIENATATITTPTEIAGSNTICSKEIIAHNSLQDNIIIDITDIMNSESNEHTTNTTNIINITNKSIKKINTSQKTLGKPKDKQCTRNSKKLSETASSLLNVYEKQMLSNTSLHENIDYFFKKYSENEERKIELKEEKIKLTKQKIKNEEIRHKFEIAKCKYLHPDFFFEY